MAMDITYLEGQIVLPNELWNKLGITRGKTFSVKWVDDHVEIRTLPKGPIEFLTGFLKGQPDSLAAELLAERKKDDRINEKHSV
jgi:bifunctional DNA-binding transcriptional regulator/antitoxin component of YhaV-PrlF toxin-antitoxin module